MAGTAVGRTAQGASFLILLQVFSRALTFVVNQILLRFLTPRILGVATQLELFSISTLYFARESIRVTIQRNGVGGTQQHLTQKELKKYGQRIQEVVNLSWAAIGLGTLLTIIFEQFYISKADDAVLGTTRFYTSLHVYSLATVIELLNEPNFAFAQQGMLYKIRAAAEMRATFLRCLVTCAVAISATRLHLDIGVLPFAVGQFTYAVVLSLSYLQRIRPYCTKFSVSLLPKAVGKNQEYIPRNLITTVSNLYGQSLFKQLLTSGDQYMIATLTTLPSQGSYALASNYGGLLARILFQPIEESARSLFAYLLAPQNEFLPTKPGSTSFGGREDAWNYIIRTLHAYSLLSLLIVALGPPLCGPLLRMVAGPAWSATEAPAVLASYCYYIPVLAFNGILEAFVASVATPAQLRNQSLWMVAFSILFACVGVVVLGRWEMGAKGLVIVNTLTMTGRVTWSWIFVSKRLRVEGNGKAWSRILPTLPSILAGYGARYALRLLGPRDGNWGDLIKASTIAAALFLLIIIFERRYLYSTYMGLGFDPSKASERKNK